MFLLEDKRGVARMSKVYSIAMLLFLITQVACRKFVTLEAPPDKIAQGNVYTNDLTATTVLTDLYAGMYTSAGNMARYAGLLADELTVYGNPGTNVMAYYSNSLTSTPTVNTGIDTWNDYYLFIYKCNAAIEGLTVSSALSTSIKNQLLGEAYFLRAWFNFYLVSLYGDIPLPISIDPEVNRLLPRVSVQSVYQFITKDLQKAQALLNEQFVNAQLKPYPANVEERVRPTKWAATALLARVYLYSGDYARAEVEASNVIGKTSLFNMVLQPDHVFLKNSQEAIWQLQGIDFGYNTWEARIFNLNADPAGFDDNRYIYFSYYLLDAFEPNDQRRIFWVDSLDNGMDIYRFPAKYKKATFSEQVVDERGMIEYSMMLRLGEQYLIRAEARAKLNQLADSIADLDKVRERAGIPLIKNISSNITKELLLELILHERQVELFSEPGHRWFDLRRFGKLESVMPAVTSGKGGEWHKTDQLLPIPYKEILYNPVLVQNPGY